ncbi:MAG: hypothetical protein KDE23_03295 [Caldilinea sp.]|nr:hypothetical protein [Caldilinea sp.]
MITVPAALVLVVLVGFAFWLIDRLGRSVEDLGHLGEPEYQPRRGGLATMLIAVVIALLLAGALGIGPLAGAIVMK